MSRRSVRTILSITAVAGLAMATAACGDSGEPAASGKVTITVNGQPAKTKPFERKMFDADVAEFERLYPDIDVQPREGFMDPKTFSAKLAGGQLEDVFYVYLTDPANLIARRQAADITDYLKDFPVVEQIQPTLKKVFTNEAGRVFGLPTANYSMGLIYHRGLFTQAGLDPNDPPSTWEEVRAAAKQISGLGNGTVGLAELSKNNQGGWHFTTWMYSMGGQIAKRDGDRWVADFNNDKGREVAETLHAMRFEDNSMGEKQLLVFEDAQRMLGAGQLGMFVGAPDNIPPLVDQFESDYNQLGLAALPGGKATLIGGEGYMINPGASPEKIRAGLKWLTWKFLDPERMESDIKRYADEGQPIGLPSAPPNSAADIWVGDLQQRQRTLREKYANVPVVNYQSFVDGLTGLDKRIEPPNAQQVYAALDNVMQGVLTNPDADVDALLDEAETKVNTALSQVK